MSRAITPNQLKSIYLILFILAATLFINTGILSAQTITFDEARYTAVVGQQLYPGGPNTLIDTELNLDFYIAFGEMHIFRQAHVGWYNYMLHFSPDNPLGADPVGRVVITFGNLQQYVRIDVSTDGSPFHPNPYLRVSFYGDTTPTNPIYTHDGSGQNIEYTDTQNGIKMLIVETKYVENNIEELEFLELGQPSQTIPPSGFIAMSNYSGAIPMAWQMPPSGQNTGSNPEFQLNAIKNPIILGSSFEKVSGNLAVQFYKIFRSNSENGTYTRIATNITRPYYRDDTVVNGQTYYYKVTAVHDAGESDFSNTASAIALSGGNSITSGWAGSTPTLDGVISGGEWSAATVTDITAPGELNSVTLYVMNDNDYLYLAVDDLGNTSLDQFDAFALIFDENFDWEWPSSNTGEEGLLQVYSDSGPVHSYQGFYGNWPDGVFGNTWSTPAGVNSSISSLSGHLVFEVRLDLTTGPLNVSAGDLFNIFFYTLEAGSSTFTGIWPKETIKNLPALATAYAWAHGAFSYGEVKMAVNAGVELQPDSLALVDLYNSTNGGNWTNNTNWLTSQPIADWFGITVFTERVTQIKLNLNNLVGTIPPSFDDLTGLTVLNLERNVISGPFPQELLSLTSLTELNIRSNNFSGSIPANIDTLTELTILSLFNNPFTGQLPPELGNLLNLQNIRISGTQIDGPIPPEIGNLSNLTNLGLRSNNLTGTIPPELGLLTNLNNLEIYNNELSGEIPAQLGNLVNLNRLFLHVNQLSGSIPVELGNLTSLDNCQLQDNNLTGTIPPEFGNLLDLYILFLDGNQLSGSIPNQIVNLTLLEKFRINDNQFVSLPDLSSLLNVTELSIQNNRFTFKDIEKNVGFATTFTYSPQDSIGVEKDTTIAFGSSLTLTISGGGASSSYQWKKDGVFISAANDSFYTIGSADLTDTGSYICEVTNTVATDLTLYSRPVNVTVENPSGILDEDAQIPKVFALHQNYPNPFNPETIITFSLPKAESVKIEIFNTSGQKVATILEKPMPAGYHDVKFNAHNLPTGLYIYRIFAGQLQDVRKMLFLK